jgi:hypothetical protein
LHFIDAINKFRMDETIGLAIHCFRPQGAGYQIDISSSQIRFQFFRFHNFDFNKRILLGDDSFTFTTIVVSAHLVVQTTKDGRPFAEL